MMGTFTRRAPSAIATLLLLSSCGGGGNTGPNPGPTAAKLAFTAQPGVTAVGAAITPAVQVAVQTSSGTTVTSATDPITIALGSNPGSATLSGTTVVNAVSGVATFADLAISAPGGGYTLVASSGTLTGATSSPFDVTGGTNSVTISVVNNQFQPKTQTVSVGTTVRWVWASGAGPHNVAPDATEPPRSGDPVTGPASYEHTFNTPGTYHYYCEVHGGPGGVGMSGTITVQ
jgi:plastocyanin